MGEWVIASINGKGPKKYEIEEAEKDDAKSEDDLELGFYQNSL